MKSRLGSLGFKLENMMILANMTTLSVILMDVKQWVPPPD